MVVTLHTCIYDWSLLLEAIRIAVDMYPTARRIQRATNDRAVEPLCLVECNVTNEILYYCAFTGPSVSKERNKSWKLFRWHGDQ